MLIKSILLQLQARSLVAVLTRLARPGVPSLVVHAAHAVLEHGLLRRHLRVLLRSGSQLLDRRASKATRAADLVSASDNIRLLANQLLASVTIGQGVEHGVVALDLGCVHVVHHVRLVLQLAVAEGSLVRLAICRPPVHRLPMLTQPALRVVSVHVGAAGTNTLDLLRVEPTKL